MSAKDIIDRISRMGHSVADETQDRSNAVLAGATTTRGHRSNPLKDDLCPTVKEGRVTPILSDKAMVVSVHPASHGEGADEASIPQVFTIGTTVQRVLFSNPDRERMILQNNGTTNIFMFFGNSTLLEKGKTFSETFYHAQLRPAQIWIDDSWFGQVDVIGDAGGGILAVSELQHSLEGDTR